MPAIRSREVQNKMKLILALAAVATLATAPVQAQTKWAMATPYPEGNFHTVNIKQFIQEIEKGSGGKLTIQLHANASLLPMPQIKRGVQSGQVQIGEILLSAYGNEDPFFAVDGTPFLADTWPLADKLMGLTRESIANRFASQGTRLLYMVNWPSQAFYSKGEIAKVDDLKGVRFRAYNAATARLAELMGATPVTVQQAEVP
ncbi:MAG: TRAP transporter substrate-binding protein DctP, partial [Alphaproteobacteria bacterium]|nr:TRAP transporter substrate-binding protein DctP [Alphaproteobacteria bacterium]